MRLSELPWSKSTAAVNTPNFKRSIWFSLNNIKWFDNTLLVHNITLQCPQLVLNTTQMFTLWKVKNNRNNCYFIPVTPSAPISHNPERSHSGRPPFTALFLVPHLGLDSILVERWWLVHDGGCRKSRKAERGVSTRTRQRHHMISQHEFCFRAYGIKEHSFLNGARPTNGDSLVLIKRVDGTYSLVEGFGLVSQMLRFWHKIIQFLSSFQKALHSVVLQRENVFPS